MFAMDSIELLKIAGIDFDQFRDHGIDAMDFAEVLMSSGVVLNPDVYFISFHSGYDFGYLLKMLTWKRLPKNEPDFFQLVQTYFPCIYDIKYLMKSCKNLKGGLQELADDIGVPRIGPQHQAGSDSLLTSGAFFKMKQLFFENYIDDEKYLGILFGLGSPEGISSEEPTIQ
eukprot:TRINITY_DN298_c0_g1_i5.p2 TRINITY_DN298_c0_g1~~TRINITY_DN298_c0_g1_i5.p2  ORF type:complete len:171 (-),score=33.73 TRINITY_DN298_c0_g1_i5:54-566(-)